MTEFIRTSNGLKPHHQQETPLFEKTYIPPDYGSRLVSRVYDDGSLYYLSETSEKESVDSKWNYISTISEKGVNEIRKSLEICCNLKTESQSQGNNPGVIVWKMRCEKQIHEITIAGIPEGKYKIFLEIDAAINTNIQTIPPG